MAVARTRERGSRERHESNKAHSHSDTLAASDMQVSRLLIHLRCHLLTLFRKRCVLLSINGIIICEFILGVAGFCANRSLAR